MKQVSSPESQINGIMTSLQSRQKHEDKLIEQRYGSCNSIGREVASHDQKNTMVGSDNTQKRKVL